MVQNLIKIFEEMFHIFIYFFRCINDFMVLVLLCYASQHIWKDNSGVWCLSLVLLLVNLKPHLFDSSLALSIETATETSETVQFSLPPQFYW